MWMLSPQPDSDHGQSECAPRTQVVIAIDDTPILSRRRGSATRAAPRPRARAGTRRAARCPGRLRPARCASRARAAGPASSLRSCRLVSCGMTPQNSASIRQCVGARLPTRNIIWNSWSRRDLDRCRPGSPSARRTATRLSKYVVPGARSFAVGEPSQPNSPSPRTSSAPAVQPSVLGQARHQPRFDALGDRIANAAMTRELARQLGRAALAVLARPRRAGAPRQQSWSVTPRAESPSVVRIVSWISISLGARASPSSRMCASADAREDPRAVQVDEAFDAELLLRLASDPEQIVDRHRADGTSAPDREVR